MVYTIKINVAEDNSDLTRSFTHVVDLDVAKRIYNSLKEQLSSVYGEDLIWEHYCRDSSTYHMNKYKHWARVITHIDKDAGTGMSAFVGDRWLSKTTEEEINENAWILEWVGCSRVPARFYQLKHKEIETKIIEGKKTAPVTFRKQCEQLMENTL